MPFVVAFVARCAHMFGLVSLSSRFETRARRKLEGEGKIKHDPKRSDAEMISMACSYAGKLPETDKAKKRRREKDASSSKDNLTKAEVRDAGKRASDLRFGASARLSAVASRDDALFSRPRSRAARSDRFDENCGTL